VTHKLYFLRCMEHNFVRSKFGDCLERFVSVLIQESENWKIKNVISFY